MSAVTLDDKYLVDDGTVYLSGCQALVRLPLAQLARDRAAGLDTACFISGYRGSPMHNVDKELWRAQRLLADRPIHFQPAVNEDLAATSVWGTQQVSLFPDARYDGVFSMWYGKGPGLDRSVDAMRHANLAGTSPHGGVLAMVGDDHAMASSDVPAASEPTFMDLKMPILYPGTVQELIELGLLGIALSRYCGAWVGFKTVSDTLDAIASVQVHPSHPEIVIPHDVEMPDGGLHIREPDPWRHQEPRLRRHKYAAALAFARANGLNRVVRGGPRCRFGIVASGKAAYDVLDALDALGIDARAAEELGIAVLKVAMPHPIDPGTLVDFADGLEEVLVVDEKHRVLELQLKDALYALADGRRPRVVGRRDEHGDLLVSELGELDPDAIALAIARRIAPFHTGPRLTERVALIEAKAHERAARAALSLARAPYFCSGCPHNTSTRVPQGSLALGGVGCHFMATYMDRDNLTHTQMGGEGANWVGIAPFVDKGHIFQNLGDGTYFHSGLLAIRACVAAGVNITYKILFNDAVAMTGGQPFDGPLSPAIISRQLAAEGVKRTVIVHDPAEPLEPRAAFAGGVSFAPRAELDEVQRSLRESDGVSAIVYVQTCAAEKRRRRKRGEFPEGPRRAFINERVCEGCGDCATRSNCLAVTPVDTALGRKRRIDQSACNKDLSCVEGFCPSFVTVRGASPRKSAGAREVPRALRLLPEPERPSIPAGGTFNVLVAGVGGTGVVTVSAMLTMAAHLEGRACSSVDQFGMAQKGGAVTSHVRLAHRPGDVSAVRLTAGSADLVLGCDALVAAGDLALDVISKDRTRVIVNTHRTITGEFVRDPDLAFPTATIESRLRAAAAPERFDLVEATAIATGLMGDAIATNLFMLGHAYQKGAVPVSAASIESAIELNGVAVEANLQAFAWGRRAGVDLDAVTALSGAPAASGAVVPSLDDLVDRRASDLVDYQDERYAQRYRALVGRAREAERARTPGMDGLAAAVARHAYKLMAYKDEYEVARLYTDGVFAASVAAAFEGDVEIELHLAPPILARRDPRTGQARKRRYGPWMLSAMRLLARMRRLRGSALDPFGYTAERRMERRLVDDYERVVEEIAAGLDRDNHALAVEIVALPDGIRGFGHVKEDSLARVRREESRLLSAWRRDAPLSKAV